MLITGQGRPLGVLVADEVASRDHLSECALILAAITPSAGAALSPLLARPVITDSSTSAPAPGELGALLSAAIADSHIPSAVIELPPTLGAATPTIRHANRALWTFLGHDPDIGAASPPAMTDVDCEALSQAAQGHPTEHAFTLPSGGSRWGLISLTRIGDDSPAAARLRLLQIQDITPRRSAQAELAHHSRHDPVTGLPNRDLLLDDLARRITEDRNAGHRTALLVLDLDDFKSVNQSLGRHGGDEYLRGVANVLRGVLRPGDSAAHLGSDEFAVVFAAVDDATTAVSLSEQLRSELAAGVAVGKSTISAAASLGVAVSRGRMPPPKLVAQAESAMFMAKRQGGNTWHLSTGHNVPSTERTVTIEADLRKAIAEDQFELRYQPVFPLQEGAALVEVEALIRWQHPVLGRMMPDSFIEVAERRNLMPAVGEWVLRAALSQAAEWQAEFGARTPQTAVNVSTKQLGTGRLPGLVADCLDATGVAADLLQLEVTESQIINASSPAAAELDALADMGIRIAVDDFGTGHAGFQYLRRLPIRVLKIDKTFIDDICTDPTDLAILTGIIALGRSLQLTLIAEGVETIDQLTLLRELGCDLGQGWLWRPALRPADAAALFGVPEAQVRAQ